MNRNLITRQVQSVVARRNASNVAHHEDHIGKIEQMKNIAMYALGGVLAFGVFTFATARHGHRTETAYPYLSVRAKAFPWKDGDTPLFESKKGHGNHH